MKTSLDELHQTISKTGYKAIVPKETKETIKAAGYTSIEEVTVDIERGAREKEIRILKTKFIFSIILATPLMYFAMAAGFKLPVPQFILLNFHDYL